MNITNMNTFTGVEYLAIDVANYAGFDKKTFEERIQWVQDNYSNLENIKVDEDPILYTKAVMALKRACNGEAIGHMVYLDATCSGIQIMSALTGCHKGANITGLINPDVRADAYTSITETLNALLKARGITGVVIERKQAKDAIMPCTYGSKEKPEEYFGADTPQLDAFYAACHKEAKGAFQLLDILRSTWQSYALQHSWKLPDGFTTIVKVTQKVKKQVHIAELFNYNMTIETKINEGTYGGVSNVANVIHSVDAFLLRELIRRCNYNKHMTKKVFHVISDHLSSGTGTKPLTDQALKYYFDLANNHGQISLAVLPDINAENVAQLPPMYLKGLLDIIEQMLQYEPFEVTTVHDAFAAHPNNCNILRHWYREIMAELAESDVIQYIIQQITGNTQYTFHKHSDNLASLIRKSNYAIC